MPHALEGAPPPPPPPPPTDGLGLPPSLDLLASDGIASLLRDATVEAANADGLRGDGVRLRGLKVSEPADDRAERFGVSAPLERDDCSGMG